VANDVLDIEPIPANGINTQSRKLNPHRLLKREHIWLWTHHCTEHGVAYVQHPACFFRDLDAGKIDTSPIKEKIAFFDIEASNLKANFGYIFSYCLKPLGAAPIERCLTPTEIRSGRFDERLCGHLCTDLRSFDRVVVYWGKSARFDLPFCRSRVLWHYQQASDKDRRKFIFPEYMALYVEDLYDTVKAKLCLHRRRMETVADFLDVPSKAHRMDYHHWTRAMAGDKDSLDWILAHNREDVETLEALWNILHGFTRRGKVSI